MHKSQIFKTPIDIDIFHDFLKQVCINKGKYYLFDKCAYKKAHYLDIIQQFIDSCALCYHKSKLHYINKKLDYCSLCTVIRQIIKYYNIRYATNIKYSKSTYEIVYNIYLFDEDDTCTSPMISPLKTSLKSPHKYTWS